MFAEIFIASLLVMFASLVGVISVWKKAGKFIEKNLGFLVSFSAGVFLIVTYELAAETIREAPMLEWGLFWIGVGAFFLWLVFKFLPTFHHHHDESDKDHTHSHIDARRIIIGDIFHNIGDGILLAASFAVDIRLGIATTVSIFVHEVVQEVSEFFVLKQAGYSTRKALRTNFLVSSTILLGALGSFFLLDRFSVLEVPLLGIAAGSFFVVVLHDLVPHSIRNSKTKTHYIKHGVWFLLGALLMILVGFIGGTHSHEGGIHDHGHEEAEDHHE